MKIFEFLKSKGKKEQQKEQPFEDEDISRRIAPAGGITFRDEKYISTGNAYIACVHVFAYPNDLDRFWLSKITNIPNTIATVDVGTEDMNEVIRNINRSMAEQSTRITMANSHADRIEASNRMMELDSLYKEISSYGEIIKNVHIRIFISNRNLFLIQEQAGKIISKLDVDRFKAAIFLNEGRQEFESLMKPYDMQMKEMYVCPGQALTASTVAGGYPFHFSCLEDDYGQFLGLTPCGGSVIFDLFHKSPARLYSNALVIGVMRSGKSSLLKKQMKQRAILGDFVRTFDITGEFRTLTEALGGKVVAADGTSGIQNPFEILKSSESDNGSFARHISKLATWYQFLVPEAESDEVTTFKNLLNELYEKFNLIPAAEHPVTGLQASYYPVMSDFYHFVEEKISEMKRKRYTGIEKDVAAHELLKIKKISNTFRDLISSYGHIFDGHTSFDNLKDVQIITYDMSELKEMDERVFDAQIFNILSTCWDNCVTNGTVMKQLYESGNLAWEDIVHFIVLIDESHRWLNANKLYAVDLIGKYLREAPKFFGGIILASQSIRDYAPEGQTEAVNELKKLFELTQYKFIFHQDSGALPLMDRLLEGVLTSAQRERITHLGMGENILCVSGNRNIEFKVYLSEKEKALFTGGV